MKNYANNSYFNSNKWINNKFALMREQMLMADGWWLLLVVIIIIIFITIACFVFVFCCCCLMMFVWSQTRHWNSLWATAHHWNADAHNSRNKLLMQITEWIEIILQEMNNFILSLNDINSARHMPPSFFILSSPSSYSFLHQFGRVFSLYNVQQTLLTLCTNFVC